MTDTWETSITTETWESNDTPGVVWTTVVSDGSGGGGVTVHNSLTGRDATDSHPIGAVTGLQGALDGKVSTSDQRLSDARTPTAHKSTHATGGSDEIAPADIGAAEETHAHDAADVTSGVIAPARLGTGTADSTTVLRGDGTWGAAGVDPARTLGPGSRYVDYWPVLFDALPTQSIATYTAGNHYFTRCIGSGQTLGTLFLSPITTAAGSGQVAYVSVYTETNGGPGTPIWSQALPIGATGSVLVTPVTLALPSGPYWLGFLNPSGNSNVSIRSLSPAVAIVGYAGNGNASASVRITGQSAVDDMTAKPFRVNEVSPGSHLIPSGPFPHIGGCL